MITCEVIGNNFYLHAGNAQGEVYIYKVSNLESAFRSDPENTLPQADLMLVDMILTEEPFVVRDIKMVSNSVFGLCTEGNKIQSWQYDEQYKQQQMFLAQSHELNQLF